MEKVEGAYDVVILKQKINEIIGYLNSQDQEEENTVCEGCGKTITSRFMQSYTKGDGMHSYCLSCDPEKQDTPGEWEDRIRDLILDISADRLVSSEKVVAIVQFLLDDREREVYVDGYKDGITRCMESLDKLLNSKKK